MWLYRRMRAAITNNNCNEDMLKEVKLRRSTGYSDVKNTIHNLWACLEKGKTGSKGRQREIMLDSLHQRLLVVHKTEGCRQT